MEAVIFIGLQGAGKSTFYQHAFSATHVRISLDALRHRRAERARVQACISGRKDFVVDNTNPTPADRARYIALAKPAGYILSAYFFVIPLRDCLGRNRQRTGKHRVPDVALYATAKKLQPPGFAEGFDQIVHVHLDSAGAFIPIPQFPPALPAPS